MNIETLGICLLVVVARVADVSLGTVRTISIVHGRGLVAWITGLFEVLIWLVAVSTVLKNLHSPPYAIAYALGYATGNYVGIQLEQRIAIGKQIVRVFTRRAVELMPAIREMGLGVTEFDGRGPEGPLSMLFIEVARRRAPAVLNHVAARDPDGYCLVDDIRTATSIVSLRQRATGWRGVFKKK